MNDSHLPPEYEKALLYMLSKISYLQCQPITQLVNSSIYEDDSLHYFDATFKSSQIPTTSGWSWNQTKNRRTLYNSYYNVNIEFYKLIPRLKRGSSLDKAPSLKLWKFTLTFVDRNMKHTILWCEKGLPKAPEMKLQDYAFLAAFLPQATAKDIWKDSLAPTF